MNILKWIVAGAIGGIIGAGVWAGISYAVNAEVGWIAWGIGVLVGLCVRSVAGEENEGVVPGLTAAGIAIASVLLGKYLAITLLIANLSTDIPLPEITSDDMISGLATEIVRERQAKGQQVALASGKTLEEAYHQADFPPDVWQQAKAKWDATPPAEQQNQMAAEKSKLQALMGAVKGQLQNEGFMASFGIFDALWFFLAAGTAFRLGHGNIASDD